MALLLRITFPGAFYHVTSRANERKAVFKSKRDLVKYLEYLESATIRYDAVIHSYCLMDNHYHLFLETPSGNLPRIMRHINGAYTTYFNAKRARSGHLFQGHYMVILVDKDARSRRMTRGHDWSLTITMRETFTPYSLPAFTGAFDLTPMFTGVTMAFHGGSL